MPVIFLQQSTCYSFLPVFINVGFPGFRWKTAGFPVESWRVSGGKPAGSRWKTSIPVESQQVSGGKPAGFQCKAFLKKFLLDFLRNSGGFHQANPDLNPGGFPVEFHWDPGRIPLGFQWNSSGIPVEILLGFRWKMLGFRWNFCRDSAFFFSWECLETIQFNYIVQKKPLNRNYIL